MVIIRDEGMGGDFQFKTWCFIKDVGDVGLAGLPLWSLRMITRGSQKWVFPL